MVYDKGNVIEKRGIVFKDNNSLDPKGKHPAMLVVAVSEDNKYMYYLTLTSQVDKYFERPELKNMYFLIKKNTYNMLRFTSLVNLQNIYKEEVAIDKPVAYIQADEYKKIKRKLINWQESCDNQDEYYKEIKELL